MKIFNCWVVATVALFYWGPIDWLGAESVMVGAYVLLNLLAFNLGAQLTFKAPVRLTHPLPLPDGRAFAYLAVGAFVLLSVAHLYFVTGRNAFSPSAYSLEFGVVYSEFYQTQRGLERGWLAFVVMATKGILFPVVLALFVKHFRTRRPLVVMVVLSLAVSSVLRGTDKELVDLLILVGVTASCYGLLTRRVLLVGIGVGTGLLALFGVRRMSRYGGDPPACLPESSVCFDYSSGVAKTLGRNAEFVYVLFTNYVTQGYQGLALALELEWIPNFGLGSLPLIKTIACRSSGVGCNLSDYSDRLQATGWDTTTRWTSAYPTIANDVSFWLVPVVMLMFGICFAKARSVWNATQAPEAACALITLAIFWLYSSANMQVGISLDWTFATLLFVYWFLVAPYARVEEPTLQAVTRGEGQREG